MPISELRERARQQFLAFAWQQWAQAGLSSNQAGLDNRAIDPEALILFTAVVAQRDPRLFDEMLDWLTVNRRLLSTQRLRNLSSRFPVDARLVAAIMAWTEAAPASLRPESESTTSPGHMAVPVFAADVLAFIGEPDPVFLSHGYLRPRAVRSGKSREPDLGIPANFPFQLRHLFGPGSRSEVMRVLLTYRDGALDAARISDESGYAKRNVNDTLTSLAVSRAVGARWSGNERLFTIAHDRWSNILEAKTSGDQFPVFMSWVHLFPAALRILAWLDSAAEADDSEYLISSQARSVIQLVAHDLEIAGIDISPMRPAPGTAYLPVFAETVESVLTLLRSAD